MRLITSMLLLFTLLVVGFARILHDGLAALLRPAPSVPGLSQDT